MGLDTHPDIPGKFGTNILAIPTCVSTMALLVARTIIGIVWSDTYLGGDSYDSKTKLPNETTAFMETLHWRRSMPVWRRTPLTPHEQLHQITLRHIQAILTHSQFNPEKRH